MPSSRLGFSLKGIDSTLTLQAIFNCCVEGVTCGAVYSNLAIFFSCAIKGQRFHLNPSWYSVQRSNIMCNSDVQRRLQPSGPIDVVRVTHASGCDGGRMRYLLSLQHFFHSFVRRCRPWVTNRSCDGVPGRSKQFVHSGCHGAGWEQQPTGLLPTRGTTAHVQTQTILVCSGSHDWIILFETSPAVVKWLLGCESALQVTDLIFLAGN